MEACEQDGLSEDQTGGAVGRMRVALLNLEIRPPADDEEAGDSVKALQPLEVDKAPIQDVQRAGLSISCGLSSLLRIKVAISPRRSSRVCSMTAALTERNGVQGNIDRHRSMIAVRAAHTDSFKSTTKDSPTYSRGVIPTKLCAKSA